MILEEIVRQMTDEHLIALYKAWSNCGYAIQMGLVGVAEAGMKADILKAEIGRRRL